MTTMQTATIQAEVPTQLITQMEVLVKQGWFQNTNDLIVDALRRLVETRRPELMEEYIWRDVAWGLHGTDGICADRATRACHARALRVQ